MNGGREGGREPYKALLCELEAYYCSNRRHLATYLVVVVVIVVVAVAEMVVMAVCILLLG
jgi:hypothetical protein